MNLLRTIPDATVQLTITSPPYFVGKEYDSSNQFSTFVEAHAKILPEVIRVTKPGGSICWQTGYFVKNGVVTPLDFAVYDLMRPYQDIYLRNRIVWAFGHGLHCQRRFSGRHEVVLWFTKGHDYFFNLDAVRVLQKYPGKRHYKGSRAGKFSGNKLGKNPEDVWNIPNVKANHCEKTSHPCQFPVALVQRLVRALTKTNDVVLDPFAGAGTTAATCVLEGRRFIGAELRKDYVKIIEQRIEAAQRKTLRYRDLATPVHEPTGREAVAKKPKHFVGVLG